jgi:hypothetical protein
MTQDSETLQSALPRGANRVGTFFTRERLANEANSAQSSSTMDIESFVSQALEQLGSGSFR